MVVDDGDEAFLLRKSSRRSHSTANSKSSKVPQQASSTKNWGVSVIPCWPDKSQRMRMMGRVSTISPPPNTLKPEQQKSVRGAGHAQYDDDDDDDDDDHEDDDDADDDGKKRQDLRIS